MSGIEISFVIVSWNVADLLRNCIQRIMDSANDITYEVIVIDNDSSDPSLEMLRSEFPWVQVIENHENVGFARANNQGFKLAKGRYVLILNPDTELLPCTLAKMKTFLDDHPSAGVVGPVILLPDQSIQPSCARKKLTLVALLLLDVVRIQRWGKLGKLFESNFLYPYDYQISQSVDAISGAAMLVRNTILLSMNGFCETFPHGGEDIYLCDMIREHGWEIWYLSEAELVHFSGQSSIQTPVSVMVNSTLSKGEYLNQAFGKINGMIYRLAIQLLYIPLMLFLACIKYCFHKSDQGLDYYFKIATGLWKWQPIGVNLTKDPNKS